ncbi:4-galactosyl-N-acetylglucosaminide 3-alpha-L-fucosyltransferase 9-like [Electrophorus electricus]|uniref:4-galactosyl-N-acetylglucosaminide 3-alpha-L-fucosyltransferase 9-like n=1 Tax=Electrophorus electricus TaxID=8005 RepID=UPI0015D0349E|nr:4-galactosyl-N-acetylglucosaminide 3-alpha-L-fucosyltransferase 9-like [Electrophorus electricus]
MRYLQTSPTVCLSLDCPSNKCVAALDKPTLLLWFWPQNYRFNLSDCKLLFDIDDCFLTDDRSLYGSADALLVFHRAIKKDLSNLPPSPRPSFQRWIWFHMESPTNTERIPGLEKLFNLTLSYRSDADIVVRNHLAIRKNPKDKIVIPQKDKLVCWIVSNTNPKTGTVVRNRYYNELKKYITVHVLGNATGQFLKHEDYYSIIASCKFYLSFENSIHRDYITEKLNAPLTVGTVPVVLGPPRENYEKFVPGSSFIHINDFLSPKSLAQYLIMVNRDEELYKSYFRWRKHLSAKPHLILQNQEFIQPICTACEYVAKHREYKGVKDIYEWYFS